MIPPKNINFDRADIAACVRTRVRFNTEKTSRVARGYEERQILAKRRAQLLTVELHGHIFFGSVVSIIQTIEQRLHFAPSKMMDSEAGTTKNEDVDATHTQGRRLVRYIVLDCAAVTGIDATAARACFLNLANILRPLGIQMLFASVSPSMRRLLQGHGVIDDDKVWSRDNDIDVAPHEADSAFCNVFENSCDAIEWCENRILAEADAEKPVQGMKRSPSESVLSSAGSGSTSGLPTILYRYIRGSRHWGSTSNTLHRSRTDATFIPSKLHLLDQYFEQKEYAPGTEIFSTGAPADALYFIKSGQVVLLADEPDPCGLGSPRPSGVGRQRRVFVPFPFPTCSIILALLSGSSALS
eukprot:SAG31_NODE_847_length_11532_cov_2.297560_8_plen_355_part_00